MRKLGKERSDFHHPDVVEEETETNFSFIFTFQQILENENTISLLEQTMKNKIFGALSNTVELSRNKISALDLLKQEESESEFLVLKQF